MIDFLLTQIESVVTLTPSETTLLTQSVTVKKLRKRHILVHSEEDLHQLFFVQKGLLRSYLSGKNNEEHTIQFAPENTWLPDSFDPATQFVSRYNIEALENAEIICIEYSAYTELLNKVPKLERYFRQVMQGRLNALHLRVINYLTHFADDKYQMFLDVYPDIVQRVPQHMIASYLGIKPETLSRNRKKIATKKKV